MDTSGSFQEWWIVSFLVLLFLSYWIGRQTEKKYLLGILIDSRGRYSLTHFQTVLWTLVILSSAIAALISGNFEPAAISFPPELLGLMGISAGSAVLATAVKGAKDDANADIAKDPSCQNCRLAQMWLEEEGDLADKAINITKFQNFIFTLVVLGFYLTIAWKKGGLPELPDNVTWLIGISHAGYVGGKIPDKGGQPQPPQR